MAKRVVLLGGTGAMGMYLAPELIKRGYKVDITTRGSNHRSGVNLRYITGDARDMNFMTQILNNNYDVIIDFMVYPTAEFKERVEALLRNTTQYIFLSTYRVFADTEIITESSPRLLDVSDDIEYLETDEYALQKAREEDILRKQKRNNWTIVRPSITYSKERFQLGVFESPYFLARALEGKATVFPAEMLNKYTTMTWAGDVAKMIAGLVLNYKAFGEDFNVVTSEHRKWSEVIAYYQKSIRLKVKVIDLDTFLRIYPGKHQVLYDRMYNRVMENAKILETIDMNKRELMKLENGLKHELQDFVAKPRFHDYNKELYSNIDSLTDGLLQKTRKKLKPRSRIQSVKTRVRVRSRARTLKQKFRVRTRLRELSATRNNARKDGLIISMNSIFNYGNVAQRYALHTVIKRQGYKFDSVDMPGWYDEVDQTIFAEMRSFISKYIGGVRYDPNMLQGYRTYIVGSDQVWRKWSDISWDVFLRYFFNFVRSKNAKRISYAASFGVDTLEQAGLDDIHIKDVAMLLEKFDYISVREKSGVLLVDQLLQRKLITTKVVLDPTLLLRSEDYSALIDNSKANNIKTAKVFCYIIDESAEKLESIKKFSRKYNSDYQIFSPRFDARYEPMEIWLKGFRDSEFVITDSFHGTVFSIINHKDFIVFNNEMRGSARFDTLLSVLGISRDRIVDNPGAMGSMKKINWIEVDEKLEALRSDSIKWLFDSIEKK